MSNCKKSILNLSDILNNEFKKTLNEDHKKRSKFIREAVILYIKENENISRLETMKNGYKEMAGINLEIAEMGFAYDVFDLNQYESKLTESDLPNDDGSEKRRYILC